MGRDPATRGSPGRRESATSVIFLLTLAPHCRGAFEGLVSLPEPTASGDGPEGLERRPLNPRFWSKGTPQWVPGHSLFGGGFYESRIDVQFATTAGV